EGPWQRFDSLLAEPYIRGRELTAAVLGDRALMVTELVPKSGFYDFDAKYTDGMTEHVCPAEIPPESTQLCLEYALMAHRRLGCRGTSRSDFRWDDEQGAEGLFLLETNTQPGMTPLSLVPEQAKHCGIDYADLVEIVIEEALVHFGKLERTGRWRRRSAAMPSPCAVRPGTRAPRPKCARPSRRRTPSSMP